MTTSIFEEEILEGLQKEQKTLPSKYFYDEVGDRLFQKIMAMPSYYLPRCEREIIREKSKSIFKHVVTNEQKMNVIELGAGDGTKTVGFLRQGVEVDSVKKYIPLDISSNILEVNKDNVHKELPHLSVQPIAGDFFKTLSKTDDFEASKLILFMGGNIGNFSREKALSFLELVQSSMSDKDYLLIAFDLKKNPKTILKAYNDDEGITKRFNLNILHRMNRELGCDINVDNFDHYPYYDPVSGVTYSYLVSLEKQVISIGDETINFDKNEVIHTEISKKYSLSDIRDLLKESGLQVVENFMDQNEFYTLSLVKTA